MLHPCKNLVTRAHSKVVLNPNANVATIILDEAIIKVVFLPLLSASVPQKKLERINDTVFSYSLPIVVKARFL